LSVTREVYKRESVRSKIIGVKQNVMIQGAASVNRCEITSMPRDRRYIAMAVSFLTEPNCSMPNH